MLGGKGLVVVRRRVVGRRAVLRRHIRLQWSFVPFLHLRAVFGLHVVLLAGLLLVRGLLVVGVGVLRLIVLLAVVLTAHVVRVALGVVILARFLIVIRLIIGVLVDLKFEVAEQISGNLGKGALIVEVIFQALQLLINAVAQVRLPEVDNRLCVVRNVPLTFADMLPRQIAHDFSQRGFFFGVDEL
ncbi:MAG: Uncharacterised protein [Pseudidiomarina mangrovi]|nr:MAG: Uncharacterised protein [Pseudidiomarina mangrovi]